MGLVALTAEAYARMLARLLPPGKLWRTDTDSVLYGVLLGSGDELARVSGRAADLLREADPRTADELLPDFERVLAIEADGTLEERRGRVVALLVQRLSLSLADIRETLAPLLDQDAEDVEIIEYGHDLEHDFADGDPGDQLSFDGNGAWSFAAGGLRCEAGIGSGVSLEFSGRRGAECPWQLWSVAAEADAWIAGSVAPDAAATTSNTGSGLLVGSLIRDEWLLVVVDEDSAGGLNVGCRTFIDGELSNLTNLGNLASTAIAHLRVQCLGGGDFEIRYATTAVAADEATPDAVAGGPASVEWAGFVVGGGPAQAGRIDVAFDDLLIRTPNGRNVFNSYVFRDPLLPGTPDMVGADLVVQRIAPPHTHAAAIQSSLVLGTAGHLGHHPLGSL